MESPNNATYPKERWLSTAATPILPTWNYTRDDALTLAAWDNFTAGDWNTTESPGLEELVLGLDAWLVPLIFAVLAVVGLAGNTMVIYIIVRNKGMHTVTNYFILSLAVTDLVFLTFSVPFTASTYLLPSWVFGEFMCKFVMYINQVAVTATCVTLTAMSVDRYYVITRPITSHRWRTPRVAKIISILIWLGSFLASVPVAVFARLEGYYWAGPQVYCAEFYPSWAWAAGYATWTFITAYLLPVVTITACCFWVVKRLWSTLVPVDITVDVKGYPGWKSPKSLTQQKRKTTLIVVVVVVLFAICWGPIQFLNMIRNFHPDFPLTMTTYYIKVWAHCMSYANSSVNPFVYAFLGHNFRKALKKMFPRCFKKMLVAPSPFLSPDEAKKWTSAALGVAQLPDQRLSVV